MKVYRGWFPLPLRTISTIRTPPRIIIASHLRAADMAEESMQSLGLLDPELDRVPDIQIDPSLTAEPADNYVALYVCLSPIRPAH